MCAMPVNVLKALFGEIFHLEVDGFRKCRMGTLNAGIQDRNGDACTRVARLMCPDGFNAPVCFQRALYSAYVTFLRGSNKLDGHGRREVDHSWVPFRIQEVSTS